jgi:hypothetical protein
MAATALERRLEALETASGGDEGCERCRGLLTIVRHAITGAVHSASWNGEALTKEELGERETEAKCARCGRDLSGDLETMIKVGGRK